MRANFFKLLGRVGLGLVARAKRQAPVQRGDLKSDIQLFDQNIYNYEISVGNSRLVGYAVWVHEGTGVYGPSGKSIKPRRKKALKTPYGPRKSIKGQKAQPYFENALNEYVLKGGLDQAIDSFGDDISQEIAKDLKTAFKGASNTLS